ncbi:MAG: PHP domain-containing protein [Candidatus Limnocylindrales bacterium]
MSPTRDRHSPPTNPIVPSGPSRVDLHTHTLRSDGTVAPRDLVEQAAAAGVRYLAITDHDDLSAFRDLTAPGAPDLPAGLDLLPGVEINCLTAGQPALWEGELHVLGFGVRADDEAFEAVLTRQRQGRRIRFERTLEILRQDGLSVDAAAEQLDLSATESLGRPTVARLMISSGYATSVEDAFQRWLGRGRPAYVPREGIGPVQAIQAIRAAGGLPVLAHFSEAEARQSLVRDLQQLGLGGLEVYYRTFDQEHVASVGRVAAELGLVRTGGSDFHGDTGPYAQIHAETWVPEVVGERLRNALAQRPAAWSSARG